MKKLYSTILPIVMILCLAMLSSCSGSSDETENGGTDDGILRITADKTAIQADGVEKVTFTDKLGTQRSREKKIWIMAFVLSALQCRVRMFLKPAIMREKQWLVKMK